MTLAAPTVALAHGTGTLHYFGNCPDGDQPSPIPSRGYIFDRDSTEGGSDHIYGVRAQIVGRDLYPCIGGDGNHVSKTFMLASLDGTGSTPGGPIHQTVQFGLGKWNLAAGSGSDNCNNDDNVENSTLKFMYTTNTAGNMCAAGWVDFNGNGTPDNPVLTHHYVFSITEYDDAGGYHWWRYCVQDLDLAGDPTECHNGGRGTSNGGLWGYAAAWWGCEMGSSANGLGVREDFAQMVMHAPAWKAYNNPGVWQETDNSDTIDAGIYNPWGTSIATTYFKYTYVDNGSNEDFSCYTKLH
jgi:hypothetical protein